jgi:hypothetical protein
MHGIEDWIDMTPGAAVMEYSGEEEVLVDVDVVELDDCASAPIARMMIMQASIMRESPRETRIWNRDRK